MSFMKFSSKRVPLLIYHTYEGCIQHLSTFYHWIFCNLIFHYYREYFLLCPYNFIPWFNISTAASYIPLYSIHKVFTKFYPASHQFVMIIMVHNKNWKTFSQSKIQNYKKTFSSYFLWFLFCNRKLERKIFPSDSKVIFTLQYNEQKKITENLLVWIDFSLFFPSMSEIGIFRITKKYWGKMLNTFHRINILK